MGERNSELTTSVTNAKWSLGPGRTRVRGGSACLWSNMEEEEGEDAATQGRPGLHQ